MPTRPQAVREPHPVQLELVAKFFRGLGDPKRLQILMALMTEPRRVKELVALLGAGQGRVSNHLACLRWCGYVATRSVGREVYYEIRDRRVRKLLALGFGMVADHARQLAECTRIGEE